MYEFHFYDRAGFPRSEWLRSKAIAIAIAEQAIGEAWVTDDKGEIVYEKPADAKLDKPPEM